MKIEAVTIVSLEKDIMSIHESLDPAPESRTWGFALFLDKY